MRVLLLTPWSNAWIPYFRNEVEKRGGMFALGKTWNGTSEHDLVIHGWANGLTQPVPKAKNVMFLRRYELFDGVLSKVKWKGIDQLICVNDWIADRVREIFARNSIAVPVAVIYNGTDLDGWTFKNRGQGTKIGMACHVHPKKNLALAAQILAGLPEDYELHIAGQIQDSCTAEYLNHLGHMTCRKIYLHGHIPHEKMDWWWEQVNYCLSTSLSEGNPNNVIEAMAKGLKPIIHCWPGAEYQFDNTFKTVADAVAEIQYGDYRSSEYRELVREKFNLGNYAKVMDLCERL
jgi:glycosyltransferase involved in cell wall biosynthesis